MEIIFQKDEMYSNGAFFYQVLNNNSIDGAFFNVIFTKDEKLIVVNRVVYEKYDIKNLTLEELKKLDSDYNLSIITLEETLKTLNGTKKKIILNLIPLYLFDLTEENYEQIKTNAIRYINLFYTLIKKYSSLNIYICSRIEKTLYLINEIIKDYKIGVIVTKQNLTFIDVDFYIIDIDMYNEDISNEILNLNRELMLRALSKSDIDEAASIFKKENLSSKGKKIFNEAAFITNYPDIFYENLS